METFKIYGYKCSALALSEDNRILVSGNVSGDLNIWNMKLLRNVDIVEAYEEKVTGLSIF